MIGGIGTDARGTPLEELGVVDEALDVDRGGTVVTDGSSSVSSAEDGSRAVPPRAAMVVDVLEMASAPSAT